MLTTLTSLCLASCDHRRETDRSSPAGATARENIAGWMGVGAVVVGVGAGCGGHGAISPGAGVTGLVGAAVAEHLAEAAVVGSGEGTGSPIRDLATPCQAVPTGAASTSSPPGLAGQSQPQPSPSPSRP
jgi:hypothetical protein